MRTATVHGKSVSFFRGNAHRKYIPVWREEYSTPQKAKRAAREWTRRAKVTGERK